MLARRARCNAITSGSRYTELLAGSPHNPSSRHIPLFHVRGRAAPPSWPVGGKINGREFGWHCARRRVHVHRLCMSLALYQSIPETTRRQQHAHLHSMYTAADSPWPQTSTVPQLATSSRHSTTTLRPTLDSLGIYRGCDGRYFCCHPLVDRLGSGPRLVGWLAHGHLYNSYYTDFRG